MEQLPRIHRRIESLNELRDLFKALRAVAASHVLDAQQALEGARKYALAVEDAIAGGVAILSEAMTLDHPPSSAVESLLIVFCSEHGFAGAFNERLLDQVEAVRHDADNLAIIGRRGMALAEERQINVSWSQPMTTHVDGILAMTRVIAQRLSGLSSVSVLYNAHRKGGAETTPVLKSILPLDSGILKTARPGNPPLHHLDPTTLLERLADEYFFALITCAAMESLASENAARLQIMDRADHSIEDKLDGLQQKEHRLRQEQITSELIDAVIGAEAVS